MPCQTRSKTTPLKCSFILWYELTKDCSHSLKEHGKEVSTVIKTFLTQVRETVKYDFEIVFATLQKKWTTILSETDEDKTDRFVPLHGLANRLSATYGIYSARPDNMRLSLVNTICKCIDWVSADVEERKMFFKFATLPFVSKVGRLLTITYLKAWRVRLR